jgi:hypothetical protein
MAKIPYAGQESSRPARASPLANGEAMIPFALRVTPLQKARLNAQKDRDGLAVQEHIRRALDFYLGVLDGDNQLFATPMTTDPHGAHTMSANHFHGVPNDHGVPTGHDMIHDPHTGIMRPAEKPRIVRK